MSVARLALLNQKTSRELDDFDALYFMAFWYKQDRERIGGSRRSIRKLAKEASKFSVGIGSKASIEDRLRSKFKDHKKSFLERVIYSDDVEATIEDQVLKEVAKLLDPYLAMDVEAHLGRPEK